MDKKYMHFHKNKQKCRNFTPSIIMAYLRKSKKISVRKPSTSPEGNIVGGLVFKQITGEKSRVGKGSFEGVSTGNQTMQMVA